MFCVVVAYNFMLRIDSILTGMDKYLFQSGL